MIFLLYNEKYALKKARLNYALLHFNECPWYNKNNNNVNKVLKSIRFFTDCFSYELFYKGNNLYLGNKKVDIPPVIKKKINKGEPIMNIDNFYIKYA